MATTSNKSAAYNNFKAKCKSLGINSWSEYQNYILTNNIKVVSISKTK